MSLAIYTSAAWLANGGLQVAENATIEVRRESDGALASIFSDREGEEPITNPSAFGDAFGRFEFFASGGAYRVRVSQDGQEYTLRYQAIGTAGELDQEDLISPEEVDQAIGVHAEEQGGIHGIPEGERALHTGDGLPEGFEVGDYKTVSEHGTSPDPDKWIKLEAGLTGAGQYNEGKLGSESVTGSAPLVEATAQITDAESPLNGQTVHLLETERRFLRAGLAGTVENDQMQRITGAVGRVQALTGVAGGPSGAFSASEMSSSGRRFETLPEPTVNNLDFNTADSPDARVSDTTDGENRSKNIGVSVYMRIK